MPLCHSAITLYLKNTDDEHDDSNFERLAHTSQTKGSVLICQVILFKISVRIKKCNDALIHLYKHIFNTVVMQYYKRELTGSYLATRQIIKFRADNASSSLLS